MVGYGSREVVWCRYGTVHSELDVRVEGELPPPTKCTPAPGYTFFDPSLDLGGTL